MESQEILEIPGYFLLILRNINVGTSSLLKSYTFEMWHNYLAFTDNDGFLRLKEIVFLAHCTGCLLLGVLSPIPPFHLV